MKIAELKNLLKEVVREVFQEELKNIVIESLKGNKQPINESNTKTLNYTTQHVPHQQVSTPVDAKKAYMDILSEMSAGPKSGLEGDFKLQGPIDPVNGTLPSGQLDLNTIMGLIKK